MLTHDQVDAFASRPFTGNPAAGAPLREWLPDEVVQAIADEQAVRSVRSDLGALERLYPAGVIATASGRE